MGEVEPLADLAVGQARGGHLGDLQLLRRELVARVGRAAAARLARRRAAPAARARPTGSTPSASNASRARAQRRARVGRAALPAQPRAVGEQQPRARCSGHCAPGRPPARRRTAARRRRRRPAAGARSAGRRAAAATGVVGRDRLQLGDERRGRVVAVAVDGGLDEIADAPSSGRSRGRRCRSGRRSGAGASKASAWRPAPSAATPRANCTSASIGFGAHREQHRLGLGRERARPSPRRRASRRASPAAICATAPQRGCDGLARQPRGLLGGGHARRRVGPGGCASTPARPAPAASSPSRPWTRRPVDRRRRATLGRAGSRPTAVAAGDLRAGRAGSPPPPARMRAQRARARRAPRSIGAGEREDAEQRRVVARRRGSALGGARRPASRVGGVGVRPPAAERDGEQRLERELRRRARSSLGDRDERARRCAAPDHAPSSDSSRSHASRARSRGPSVERLGLAQQRRPCVAAAELGAELGGAQEAPARAAVGSLSCAARSSAVIATSIAPRRWARSAAASELGGDRPRRARSRDAARCQTRRSGSSREDVARARRGRRGAAQSSRPGGSPSARAGGGSAASTPSSVDEPRARPPA